MVVKAHACSTADFLHFRWRRLRASAVLWTAFLHSTRSHPADIGPGWLTVFQTAEQRLADYSRMGAKDEAEPVPANS